MYCTSVLILMMISAVSLVFLHGKELLWARDFSFVVRPMAWPLRTEFVAQRAQNAYDGVYHR